MKVNIDKELANLKSVLLTRANVKEVIEALDIKKYIAPVYYSLHEDIEAQEHQYYNLPGGRGSCKSSFCALEIVMGIMKDKTGLSNAIVFRRVADTMRESVYSQIAWAIDLLNVNEYWHGNVSPMCWTYKPTGAQIFFRGLDKAEKLKSLKPKRGIFRYVWLEEFAELPGENFTRNVMQSVIRGGENFTVFRSYNPPISASNWANVFINKPDDRAITLHTSYLDIPAEWLGRDFIIEAERLKEINETLYRHEYLGEVTGSGGAVFPQIQTREITDEEIQQMQYIYCGLDFGFSVDPAAFIRLSFDKKTETVYLIDEIYQKHCSNKEIAEKIKSKGYDRTATAHVGGFWPNVYYEPDPQIVICDSAEPKSIADLKNEGIKAIACNKYAGSVNYGIKWLQSKNIVIDPKRTPNAYREFAAYEYQKTKDNEFLPDVPDKDNHSIDAVRYALDRLINKRGVSA